MDANLVSLISNLADSAVDAVAWICIAVVVIKLMEKRIR